MSTEDKLGPIREDVAELKKDVKELGKLEVRIRALEVINEQREKKGSESTQSENVRWQKWYVLVAVAALIVAIVALAVK
jgi:hypothetical protein